MNKTLIKEVIKRLEKTEKFILEQAPEICQQLVTEAMIEIYFSFGSSFLFGVITTGTVIYCHYIINIPRDTYSSVFGYEMIRFFGGIVSVIAFGISIYNLQQFLYVKTCQKLFLLRKLRELL